MQYTLIGFEPSLVYFGMSFESLEEAQFRAEAGGFTGYSVGTYIDKKFVEVLRVINRRVVRSLAENKFWKDEGF